LGECLGSLGGSAQATITLSAVKVENYAGIIFVGGPGATIYQTDKNAWRVAQAAVQQHKLLAAICIAPTILALAGVLKNKQSTVWNGDKKPAVILQQAGAIFIDQPVVHDGLIITANGPAAATAFARAIINKLARP